MNTDEYYVGKENLNLNYTVVKISRNSFININAHSVYMYIYKMND